MKHPTIMSAKICNILFIFKLFFIWVVGGLIVSAQPMKERNSAVFTESPESIANIETDVCIAGGSFSPTWKSIDSVPIQPAYLVEIRSLTTVQMCHPFTLK